MKQKGDRKPACQGMDAQEDWSQLAIPGANGRAVRDHQAWIEHDQNGDGRKKDEHGPGKDRKTRQSIKDAEEKEERNE